MPFFLNRSGEGAGEQPLWKDEFSVFAADERYVNRRQLTKFLTLTSFAMLAGNLWILARSWFRRAASFPARVVAHAGDMAVGGVTIFHYPGPQDDCILVRTGADAYVAYSQKCTHLSCAVLYSRESGCLECPCHKGYFSLTDGRPLAGPPPRPLPRVLLARRGGDLVATGIDLGERS